MQRGWLGAEVGGQKARAEAGTQKSEHEGQLMSEGYNLRKPMAGFLPASGQPSTVIKTAGGVRGSAVRGDSCLGRDGAVGHKQRGSTY